MIYLQINILNLYLVFIQVMHELFGTILEGKNEKKYRIYEKKL